jgi:7,8-dihydropterin-6-yl-methyl-4-(beta-D-ribofuranosyl)aminobenzene 5'-phosphate synthase
MMHDPILQPMDRLEVLVLVDNVTDQLSTTPDGVQSEFAALRRAGLTTIAGESICCAHHGLSLLITAHRDGARRTLLFDTGPEGYAIQRNAGLLGVDLSAVDDLVLSHGHWDHCGGALTALELIAAARGRPRTSRASPRPGVTVHAHPGMFSPRGRRMPDEKVIPFKSIPTPVEMNEAGAQVVVTDERQRLHDGAFHVSGEIPRVTAYEQGLPDHVRRHEASGGWEPDPLIMDERFLAVHVRAKGLVVFSGCSHAGIVNVLTHARALFPDVPLFAAVGGLHLSGVGPERIIGETVKDLAGFGLRRIVPAHCTGWRAVIALVTAFGEPAITPAAVGKSFTF